MSVEEARAALDVQVILLRDGVSNPDAQGYAIMEAADAYALAARLAGHVDACGAAGRTASGKGWRRRECGDGWYCEKAKEIQELGR
jgi:hypothetical protein